MLRQMIFAALAAACLTAAPRLLPQSPEPVAKAPAQEAGAAASVPEKPAAGSKNNSADPSQAAPGRPARAEIIAANSVEGSRYSNRALGFSFEIPNEMGVEGALTAKEILDAGHRAAHASDPASDPVHRQAEAQTIHLISLADRPSSAASGPAQILVIAYDLGAEQFSNQEIAAAIAAGMSAEPGEWQVTDAPHEQEYGRAKFWQQGLKGTIPFGGRTISVYVEILVTQRRGFAVAWDLSASSQERLDALLKSLETIRWEAAPHPSGTKSE